MQLGPPSLGPMDYCRVSIPLQWSPLHILATIALFPDSGRYQLQEDLLL